MKKTAKRLPGSASLISDLRFHPEEFDGMSQEQLEQGVREAMSRMFARQMEKTVNGYQALAVEANSEEVRRKASEYIFSRFDAKTPANSTGSGIQVQILNQIPLPEVSRVSGQDTPTLTIRGQKIPMGTVQTSIEMKKVIKPKELTKTTKKDILTGSALDIPTLYRKKTPEPSMREVAPVESLDKRLTAVKAQGPKPR
jgi:hypothetical protein